MLVANADDEIDRDVYNGRKTVVSEEIDVSEFAAAIAKADATD